MNNGLSYILILYINHLTHKLNQIRIMSKTSESMGVQILASIYLTQVHSCNYNLQLNTWAVNIHSCISCWNGSRCHRGEYSLSMLDFVN